MRLIPILGARLPSTRWPIPWLFALWACLLLVGTRAHAAPPERDPEDILGELVVEAGKSGPARLVLPVLGVESPLSETPVEARTREVVTRDLALSGEFSVVPAAHAPVRPVDAAAPVDPEPWRARGVDVVVRIHAQRIPVGRVELRAEIHLLSDGRDTVLERTMVGPLSAERLTTHRLTDAVIGALTGYEGPFASRLSFVHTTHGRRTVYVIDPDGHGLLARTPDEQLAVAPAFDAQGVLHWAASIDGGRYRLYRERRAEPIELDPSGSIYGLAFDGPRDRVAVSIATASGVQVFTGRSDFTDLQPVTKLMLAMHPAFSPRGGLAYAGTAKTLQRVYVDRRPVSLPGLSASAPVFCGHPDGVKLVYEVGVRGRSDLVVTDRRGRDPMRLTKGQGRNSYPACSPDGRLIAFFSTRRTGEGPGLYVMRVDGRRARKISNFVGDSLQWSGRLPERVVTPSSADPSLVPDSAAASEEEAVPPGPPRLPGIDEEDEDDP